MPTSPIQRQSATTVTRDGREFILFAGCNYLGLAQHPAVLHALTAAAAMFGISTSASRQTTGNAIVHEQLERAIAALVGKPDAVLLLDGYTANLAAAQVLGEEERAVVLDARAHRSLKDAFKATGHPLAYYPHRDAAAAGALTRTPPPAGVVLATDSVFAADGAVAPLSQLAAELPENAVILLDDCHGLGVLGDGGRGGLAHAGIDEAAADRVIVSGTLAKAIGCHGGFVAGPAWFCKAVRERSGIYITTTPQPPAIAAAAIEAIAILAREPDRLARLRRNADLLGSGLRSLGLDPVETPAPIFAFTLEPRRMREIQAGLLGDRFIAPVLSYPDGPSDSYFRLAVTSEHTADQIDALLSALKRLL